MQILVLVYVVTQLYAWLCHMAIIYSINSTASLQVEHSVADLVCSC
jgi:hypothetical protein